MIFLFILITSLHSVYCRNILLIPTQNAPSHAKSMYVLGEGLRRAGHNVSLLQLIDYPSRETRNTFGIHDVVIHTIRPTLNDDWAGALKPLYWNKRSYTVTTLLYRHAVHSMEICARILSHDSTRNRFYSILNETWDVVIMDNYSPACGVMAVNRGLLRSDPILIDFSMMGLFSGSLEHRGAHVPTSVHIGTTYEQPYFDHRRFIDRMTSTVQSVMAKIALELAYRVSSYQSGHLDVLHDVRPSGLHEKSTYAVTGLPNGLDYTQPRTLDIGEYDYPCAVDSSLPEKLNDFVNDPTSRGTIVFAVGHFIDWNYAPPGVFEAFRDAFARLDEYRIVWQMGLKPDQLKDISSNVMVDNWLPQTALLNHKNTKLFISHMGMKSVKETICAGVPVVALPFYVDHYRNTAIGQHRGFALFVDKTHLSADVIYTSLKTVLDNARYTRKIQRLRAQLTDRIRHQQSIFIFQLEYFLRHNKEKILRKFIKTKWSNLPVFARWANMESVIPCALFVLAVFLLLS